MKKVLIIVLLLAALGITLYYTNQRTCNKPFQEISELFNHELLIGKWKLDSIVLSKDSTSDFKKGIIGIVAPDLMKYQYEFKTGGAVVLVDSLTKDSSNYEWNKKDQLVWKEHPADTSGEIFNVSIPHKDSLRLQSTDSVVLLFTKVKE